MNFDDTIRSVYEEEGDKLNMSLKRRDEILSYIEEKALVRNRRRAPWIFAGIQRFCKSLRLIDFVEVAVFALIVIAIPMYIKFGGAFNNSGAPKNTAEINDTGAKEAPTLRDYFPLKKQILTYNGGFENGGSRRTVQYIEDDKLQLKVANGATEVAQVYKVGDSDVTLIFSKEEEYGSTSFIDAEHNRNEILLKAPLEVGQNWLDSYGNKVEITGTDINVTTPAGVYNTIEVTTTAKDYTNKVYYGKGIGPVKFVSIGSGYTMIEELIKVE